MARFRGTIAGQRGAASRLGSKSSGLTVTCNGWDNGVLVEAHADEPRELKAGEQEKDSFYVSFNGGSNGNGSTVAFRFVNGQVRAALGFGSEDTKKINRILAKYDRGQSARDQWGKGITDLSKTAGVKED